MMKEKLVSLTRLWYLPPLLAAALSFAGAYYYDEWGSASYLCMGLSVLLLVFQVVLLLAALGLRRWWTALGVLLSGALSTVVVCLCMTALLLSDGMEKIHGKGATKASYEYHEGQVHCSILAVVPDSALALAVGEWLDEQLGGYYPADPADVEAVVEFYGDALCDTLRQALAEGATEVEFDAEMVKAYESPQLVTYSLSTCLGLGGAHPLSSETGATFRKSDGRRVSWDIIRRDMRYSLNEALVEMLCDYFGVKGEEELGDMLMTGDAYSVPLPETPPYFLENGVAVIYQQYEIAAYAMGMPGDTIPYSRLQPLMTEWAKRLIEQ